MRRVIVVATLLTLWAPAAHAQYGINLSWDDCGLAGTTLKTFSCDTNTGAQVLVGSFRPPFTLPAVTGMDALIDIQTPTYSVPSWWYLEPTGCRGASPGLVAVDVNSAGTPSCPNLWGGAASGGTSFHVFSYFARLDVLASLPETIPVYSGTEYEVFRVMISNQRTTDCTGCLNAACLWLEQIYMVRDVPGLYGLSTPLDHEFVYWQVDQGAPDPRGRCPGAVPTRATTWGAIKSMYR